jgi:hypothetical protein
MPLSPCVGVGSWETPYSPICLAGFHLSPNDVYRTSNSNRSGDFRISLLLIRGHNFAFILMAAVIAFGCVSILLGELRCELLWTAN